MMVHTCISRTATGSIGVIPFLSFSFLTYFMHLLTSNTVKLLLLFVSLFMLWHRVKSCSVRRLLEYYFRLYCLNQNEALNGSLFDNFFPSDLVLS